MDHPGQKGYGSPAYASTLRPPRGKALLPTPIPNLTKKSRGRRVPTADDDPHDKRMYACPAVGCGKCFHRGEHLKRHIRSIHTNDKPFRCEERNCGKYFNRHDNLLQHLKVHSLTDSGQLPMPISRPSKRKDSLPSPLSLDTGLQLYNALAYQPSLQASSSNTDRSASPSTSSQVSHAELAVSATRTELPSGEVPLDAPTLPDDVSSEQQHQHHHQQFPPFYPPQFDWHQHPPYFSSDVAHTVPHPQSLDEQLWN
ncbi:hypothetical protein CYLTODRAFT_351688 [Cylindrobasidium torrendii FP15055 ss-10]|uniref:C2H2-type domain-containing protein n=1 Tax=Cylindrobasidium torrendii FP15055 ss-10 TaxID=1314674 RepID=A0A0D7BDP1_9AGAR|nr:hypothetical protein CYLTODRAFT_351688 [Cylindrobasidium torrendii FP15055 ss-10]